MSQTFRPPNRFGVSQAKLAELQGLLILFLAAVSFLAILSVSIQRPSNFVGPVGEYLARFLMFLLGQFVAYIVPATLAVWGVTRFRNVEWPRIPVKIAGLVLLSVGACGLLAQIGSDWVAFEPTDAYRDMRSFDLGGALGAFLISDEGANLPRYLDRTGTYLTMATIVAMGLLLATDFLFYTFFAGLWRRFRSGQRAVVGQLGKWTEQIKNIRPPRTSATRGGRVFGGTLELGGIAAGGVPPSRELPSLAVESPIGHVIAEDDKDAEAEEEDNGDDEAADDSEDSLEQAEQMDMFDAYQIPPLDLLTPPVPSPEGLTAEDIEALSRTIEEKLASFGVEVKVVHVTQGPVVTLFEVQPADGIKINRIKTVENDLAMALRATRLRILAPIPGRGTVGLEIPNRKPSIVRLREILESRDFQGQESPLLFGLGKTIDGRPYVCNLARMPHLLIAGATGSGKSVCLNSIICSFLLANPPDRLRFLMIDPKRVELSVYQGIPHLLAPVVCDPRKAAAALQWVVCKMEERYRQLASLGVRSIDGYNAIANDRKASLERTGHEVPRMPHIVIIVDELADLMYVARNEVEENIIRLAQMSRAVGIHLILATQRPSVNVITGIIKANFPCRIAFQVPSQVDSKTILDTKGAESLLGQGDMLFSGGGSLRPQRIQGAYVSDAEIERLVKFITAQGKAMTEEQLAAQEAIEAAGARATLQIRRNGADESGLSGESEDDGGPSDISDASDTSDGPRSIDDVERVLGPERDKPPVRIQYAVDDFTAPPPEDEMGDELYERALRLVIESRKASVSLIQRRLKIGFARAGRLMDLMEDNGIVGPYQGAKPRQLLVDPVEFLRKWDAEKKIPKVGPNRPPKKSTPPGAAE
ncbi:MAG: DNA translocase FtsK [Candidatus Sumerlaeia bacterium]|nr:DNA translocase FtsK [Candidatus Sumerlaeia bacterium]